MTLTLKITPHAPLRVTLPPPAAAPHAPLVVKLPASQPPLKMTLAVSPQKAEGAGSPAESTDNSLDDDLDAPVVCVCGATADDGAAMVQCDGCLVWAHIACYGFDPDDETTLPPVFLCTQCAAAPRARRADGKVYCWTRPLLAASLRGGSRATPA